MSKIVQIGAVILKTLALQ